MKSNNGFIFIGDPIIPLVQQYNIAPGYMLKKANSDQIRIIKDSISKLGVVANSYNYRRLYETKAQSFEAGTVEFTEIDEIDYKYWVIEHDSRQTQLDLLRSLKLTSFNLSFIFDYRYFNCESTSIQCNPNRIHNFYEHHQSIDQEKNVDSGIIFEMNQIYPALTTLRKKSHEFPSIIKSIDDYFSVDTVSKISPFYVVSLLSILENLLANSPADSQGTSITKQLQRKIELLNNHSNYSINLSSYFDSSVKLDTIISRIYDYRSMIAHGSSVDFKGKLKSLKSNINVTTFLDELIRVLLVHSLTEPQLVKDLKRC